MTFKKVFTQSNYIFKLAFYLILFNYFRAEKNLNEHLVVVETWDDFMKNLDQKKIIMAPFCGDKEWEEKIKEESAR